VNRFIFDHGFAPTVEQLAKALDVDKIEIENGLRELANNHAIVLHPNSFDIWVAHPFALFPTLFWVSTKEKQWWGNCPWCSFGIASLTNTDTDIFTRLKGEQEAIKIEIRNHEVVQKDYVVHFPIPARRFWNNVVYTCSMMLVFRNETEIDKWCRQHNKPKGEVLPIEQVWSLAKIWYGNYLDTNFKRKTKEIAEDMFRQVGLSTDFWRL
jgi:hypothetical protein